MKVKFTILGEPAGKGRPRFRSVGPYVKTYTPEKTASYKDPSSYADEYGAGNDWNEIDEGDGECPF